MVLIFLKIIKKHEISSAMYIYFLPKHIGRFQEKQSEDKTYQRLHGLLKESITINEDKTYQRLHGIKFI